MKKTGLGGNSGNSGGSGIAGGPLKIAKRIDGSAAIFASKMALDAYTNNNTAWANSLKSDESVGLGINNNKINFAYVRRNNDWLDIVTLFQGEKGEQGESGVRVILLVNRRVGNELITTIDLNDGTSVTSEPINIAQNAHDSLLEGIASGFIYAKIVEVG